ncbi:hypothetical protein E4U59_001419 [Claviceps monticola]|nr:hypothetical protein E4U59_001419 [Claviceps monticola]
MDGGDRECAGLGIGAPGAAAFARENGAVVSGMTASLVSLLSVASVVCVLCKEKQDPDKSILDGQNLGRV